MRGITEERLVELCDGTPNETIDWIIRQCIELNPWMPIDKKTPRNRKILLFRKELGQFVSVYKKGSFRLEPTLWQELPPDPKE